MRDTLSITEAAAMAGVDRTTLSRAMRAGSVPVPLLRIGKCVRVPRARFIAWIAGELPPESPATGGGAIPPASPPSSQ
jgi:excisionase family DNA binding protein